MTDPQAYLTQFEPELKKKLESHALRGEVCKMMERYVELFQLKTPEERHEFLKKYLSKNK